MSAVPTVKIKADNDRGFKLINQSDFDPKVHKPYDAEAKAAQEAVKAKGPLNAEEEHMYREFEARKRFDANRGQSDGHVPADSTKNPTGTYSEPTPTDIRYPNKEGTEFENNLNLRRDNAAGVREQLGLPDKPGGIMPDEDRAAAVEGQDFSKMKVEELRAFAEKNRIDLGDATRKADLIAAIEDWSKEDFDERQNAKGGNDLSAVTPAPVTP